MDAPDRSDLFWQADGHLPDPNPPYCVGLRHGAAREGAVVVFHPHCTGSDRTGVTPNTWGAVDGAYYEKAVMCRALENTIYVASVNYAFRFPESATCLIGPSGECEGHLPYGEEGLLVRELEPAAATGLLAQRFAPDRFRPPSE